HPNCIRDWELTRSPPENHPPTFRSSICTVSDKKGIIWHMSVPMTSTSATANIPSPMVVSCVAYRTDGSRLGDIELNAISDALKESNTFVWVGLHEPDEALLIKLQEEFDLHDLAVEDAQQAHQRTKVETYGDSLFIVVQTAQLVEGHIAFGETHIFLVPRYLVSVRHGASLS